jgi:hypothetical protein
MVEQGKRVERKATRRSDWSVDQIIGNEKKKRTRQRAAGLRRPRMPRALIGHVARTGFVSVYSVCNRIQRTTDRPLKGFPRVTCHT